MKLLAIDIGTSSVRIAILVGPKKSIVNTSVAIVTSREEDRAEVDISSIESALIAAIKKLGKEAKKVDLIAHSTMAPSWVAMDKAGRVITPVVTHQDRRSINEARWIEKTVGKKNHLKLTGNRPIPGGISSTSWLWFNRNQPARMKKASLVGHLNTWLTFQLTGERFTDPSHAGFTGLYQTTTLGGWSQQLYTLIGAFEDQFPSIIDANVIAGGVTAEAADRFGLKIGTPILAGCMDGSAAMLSAGVEKGQLLNVSGSTDVLAMVVDHPKPHVNLLTRPLGIGRKWLAVSTLAAAGSAIDWVWKTFFSELTAEEFYRLLEQIDFNKKTSVEFIPLLAGLRTEIEPVHGLIRNLNLSTSREDILKSVCMGLSILSSNRLELLENQYGWIKPRVAVSGGISDTVTRIIRRDWKTMKKYRFHAIPNATLHGLWNLAQQAK